MQFVGKHTRKWAGATALPQYLGPWSDGRSPQPKQQRCSPRALLERARHIEVRASIFWILRYLDRQVMEIQSRRLHDVAARGAMDVCLDARNAGGAVTFVPQDAPVSPRAAKHGAANPFLQRLRRRDHAITVVSDALLASVPALVGVLDGLC